MKFTDQCPIKERNEYYCLEAVASTIGKFIHKKGNISLARSNLQESIIKPFCASGEGQETLIFSHTPSVQEAKVDEMFFDLQKWHRSVEQHLNQVKYDIKRRITVERIKRANEYRLQREKYMSRKQELILQFNEWQSKESERVARLKIVIPQALQQTFDYQSSLEK